MNHLPIELQNLIYMFSGTYREIMKQVLRDIRQRGYKYEVTNTFKFSTYYRIQQINGRHIMKYLNTYNYNVISTPCVVCSTKKLMLINQKYSFYHLICSRKCKTQYENENPQYMTNDETNIYDEHLDFHIFKRHNYYLVYNEDQ